MHKAFLCLNISFIGGMALWLKQISKSMQIKRVHPVDTSSSALAKDIAL